MKNRAFRIASLISQLQALWCYIGYLTIILVVGNYGCRLLRVTLLNSPGRIGPTDIRSTKGSPVWKRYPKSINPDEFIQQAASVKAEYFPYVVFRTKTFTSEHVNINKDRFNTRKTIKNSNATAKKVFVFGGSTVHGYGVPDSYTIPSLLQYRLGHDYDVTNFGEIGFQSTQELHLLIEILASGNIPDIVIFYDGFNDHISGTYFGNPRNLIFHGNIKLARSLMLDLLRNSEYYRLAKKIKQLRFDSRELDKNFVNQSLQRAKVVVANYENHIKSVNALAAAYGFKPFFFWQPCLLYVPEGQRKSFDYENKIQADWQPGVIKVFRKAAQIYKESFSNRTAENIFYLVDIFDDVGEVVYLDAIHLGPNGNKIVADEIFDLVKHRI